MMAMSWRKNIRHFFAHPPGSIKALLLIAVMIFYSAAAFMFFELEGKPELQWHDAVWWAIVTMTTVGFGDYSPASPLGRVFAGFPAMLVGVGMLGFALGQVASFFIKAEAFNRRGYRMHKLKGHIVICNYPSKKRLMRIVQEFRAAGGLDDTPMVLVDEHLDELDPELTHHILFVRGNPTHERVLERACIATASRVVVLARDPHKSESDSISAACCLTAKHLCPKVRAVCECVDSQNAELMTRAGSDGVICMQDLAPGIIAREIEDPGVADVLHELTNWKNHLSNIFIVPVHHAGGRHLSELHELCTKAQIILIGVRSAKEQVELNPSMTRTLSPGDSAIVIAMQRPAPFNLSV